MVKDGTKCSVCKVKNEHCKQILKKINSFHHSLPDLTKKYIIVSNKEGCCQKVEVVSE